MKFNSFKKSLKLKLQALKCLLTYRYKDVQLPMVVKEKEDVLTIVNKDSEGDFYQIPKIIWIYWHEGLMPQFMQKNIERIKDLNADHIVHILDKESVMQYIPDLHITGDMQLAHRADYIRLELLSRFGGVWIDPSIIFYEDLSWVQDAQNKKTFDLVGYFRELATIDKAFPVIETWFLATPKGSTFINSWLEIFKPVTRLGSLGYYNYLIKNYNVSDFNERFVNVEYFIFNFAEQIASRNTPARNLYLKRSEDSAFFIQDSFFSNYKTNYAITQIDAEEYSLPLIKLSSGDRMFVDTFYNWGMINKKSVIGRLLYN